MITEFSRVIAVTIGTVELQGLYKELCHSSTYLDERGKTTFPNNLASCNRTLFLAK